MYVAMWVSCCLKPKRIKWQIQRKKKKTENPVAVNNGNNGIVKNKKKNKEVAPFGNYRNYYGYRVGHDVEEDPRFKVLKKEWFEGKDCLDIGCNSGLITINIAKKFDCRTILGIDNIFLFLVTSYQ